MLLTLAQGLFGAFAFADIVEKNGNSPQMSLTNAEGIHVIPAVKLYSELFEGYSYQSSRMYPVVERVNLTYSGQNACRGVPACRAITGNRGLLKAIVDKMTGGVESLSSSLISNFSRRHEIWQRKPILRRKNGS